MLLILKVYREALTVVVLLVQRLMARGLFYWVGFRKNAFALSVANAFIYCFLSVISYLLYNNYPVFLLESILLISVTFIVVLVILCISYIIRAPWVFYAFLALLFVDMNLAVIHHPFWARWVSGAVQNSALWHYASLVLLYSVFAYCYRVNLPLFFFKSLILALMLTVIVRVCASPTLTKTMVKENKISFSGAASKGDLFIFILDEHGGVADPLYHKSEGSVLRKRLIKHYRSRGFTIYLRAFSNYTHTSSSLPSLVNFELANRDGPISGSYEITKNKLLEKAFAGGYPLYIYQSSIIDFCGAFKFRYQECFEYNARNLGYAKDLAFSRAKFLLLFDAFVYGHQSPVLFALHRLGVKIISRPIWFRVSPVAAMSVFPKIKEDIKTSPEGSLFFVHLLLPHAPYVYDANCQLKKVEAWSQVDNDDRDEMEIRRGYYEQATCVDKQIEELFKVMDNEKRFKRASILVFGDHGSRISKLMPLAENAGGFTQQDWREYFAPWVAVKKSVEDDDLTVPQGQVSGDKVSVAQIAHDFVGSAEDASEKRLAFSKVYLRESLTSDQLVAYDPPE